MNENGNWLPDLEDNESNDPLEEAREWGTAPFDEEPEMKP